MTALEFSSKADAQRAPLQRLQYILCFFVLTSRCGHRPLQRLKYVSCLSLFSGRCGHRPLQHLQLITHTNYNFNLNIISHTDDILFPISLF